MMNFNTNMDIRDRGYLLETEIPLDGRTVVETFDDIPSIPNPFVGMQVFVKDSNELYLVKKIDERIDEEGLSEYFINTIDEHALARMVNSDNIDSIVGPIEGVAYLTSYVFTRATSKPSKPNGGLFTKPYPTIESDGETIKDPNWHDTVPSTGVGAIYMSYCTFCSDTSKNGEWTDPSKLSDSPDFQVEFTARDLSAIPQYKPSKFTGNQNEWRQQELNGKYQVVWGDDTITDIKYMATAVSHDGVWEDWTVIKIKGEKGDKGDQGEGAKISLKGKFSSLDALIIEWNLYRNDIESYPPNTEGPHFLLPLEIGDGYIVDKNGHLYVYSGDDSDFYSCWTDAGVIKGDSAYLYIRYSNNDDGEGFWDPDVDDTPGRYIGTKTSTYPLNPDDLAKKETFTWTLWRGEDGWGYEQVFLLTHKSKGGYSENNGPNVPNTSERVPDYLPPHGLNQDSVMGANNNTTWADRPLTTSETWPLCWVVTRKAGKEYSAWKGDVNTGKATLYSKYVTDGIPGTSPFFLELSNDQAVLPLENGTIDPGFEDEISTELYLYEGNNPITNNIEYSIDPSNVGTFTNNKVVFNKSKLNDISEVICTAKYPVINGNNTNAKPYSRKFRITKTNNAYEIVPSTHVLVRDEYGDISSTTNLSVEVKKWDSAENVWKVPSDKYLWITYYYVSGEPTTTNTSITNNIPIDLDKENLTAIKFYITDDNTKDGTELSYEQVGVIANVNGDNGDTYKTVYAFTRCDDTDIANAIPRGGEWDSAKPEETTVNNVPYEWHDTVPDGTGAIWVTTRQFMWGNDSFGSWSNPKKMSDTADFEVEFSAGKMKEDGTLDVETKPSLKSLQDFTSIDTWKADEQHKDWNWADDVPGAVWMATAVKHGSTWSDWSVVRIKGEKGESGANGTSVKILGTGKIVETFPETQLTWDDGRENNNVEYILYKNKTSDTTYKYIIYKWNGSEYAELENNENGDGYIFEGDLWTWDGDSWENVGKVQGPAGSSAYLYVRCSDTEGTSKVLKDEGETGKYIGYYASTEPKTEDELQQLSNNNKFVWAKWSGEDGWGWEQIYLLTTTAYAWDKGPDISNLSNEKNVDYQPDHGLNTDELIVAKGDASNTAKWSDIPLVPTEEFPYCWETRRKVQGPIVDGKWSDVGMWIKDSNGRAILYDRYVTNGKNAVHLELSNDFATVPVDKNGTVDPDFILAENIFTELQLYEGGKKVENGVKYDVVSSSDNSYTASCEGNKVTVTAINEDYVFVQCKATYNDTDYFKNFRVQKREEAWRLKLTGTNVIKKSYDAQNNLTITSGTIGFEVEKWNDVKWDRVNNKPVFVEYVLNGTPTTVKVTNGGYNFNSVDASATNFRVYITDNDKPLSEGSTMLDQEWLGVVSDGINGKDTYSIELTNDVGTIPLEPNGQIDTQAGDVTTSIQMLKGNVVITKQDGVTYEMNVTKSEAITLTDEGVLTIHPNNFTSASDIPQSIELSAVHGSVTLKKVFRINVSQNAYELIPYKTMLQRDLTTDKLVSSDKKLKVSVRKWDSETNEWKNPVETQGLYIHVDCEHIGTKTGHTTNVFSSVTDGEIELDLSAESNLKSIRLYLSNKNSLSDAKTNYLTFEDIGVYANGEDGNEIEFLYYLTNEEKTPINPTPLNWENNENYQVSEWTPSKYFVDANITTGQYTSSDGAGIYITEAVAKKWTDDPGNVSATQRFQYVAMRKRVDGKWQAFFTPVIWSAYGERGPEGPSGGSGTDASVCQLSNPSATILIVDGTFDTDKVYSKVFVRKGDTPKSITNVTIDAVRIDKEAVTDKVSVNLEDNKEDLTFTVSNLELKPQRIEVDLNINSEVGTFKETQTILVLSGGSSVHLELSEDWVSIGQDRIDNPDIEIEATLYDGLNKATGVKYNITCDKCEATINEGNIAITKFTGDVRDVGTIDVTATYCGSTYKKTITVNSGIDWKINLDTVVINPKELHDITGSVSGSELESSNVSLKYSIDSADETSIDTPSNFTVTTDTLSSIKNNIVFTLYDSNSNILDKETIGVVNNGSSEYYQIEVNHEWIVKDSNSTVKSPLEDITPRVMYYKDGVATKVTNYSSLFKIWYRIDSGDIQEYSDSVDPSNVTILLDFYLCEKDVPKDNVLSAYIDHEDVKVTQTEPGEEPTPKKSPVIYSAGDFDVAKAINGEYVGDTNKAPYVLYSTNNEYKGFYIAYGTPKSAPSQNTIYDGDLDWETANTVNKWIRMDMFKAIYSDIGVFQHALVGKWVFHDDYMFSQDGYLGNPKSGSFGMVGIQDGNKTSGDECSYDLVANHGIIFNGIPDQENGWKKWPLYQHIEFGSWIPNIWFNAKTGAGRLGDGMHWDDKGKVTFTKSFELLAVNIPVRDRSSYNFFDTQESIEDWNNKNIYLSAIDMEDSMFNQAIYLSIPESFKTEEKSISFTLTNTTNNIVAMYVSDEYDELNENSNFVVRAPILSSSGSMISEYKSIIIYPNSSLDVIISNIETGDYSKFICTTVNPLWKVSYSWDVWSVCNVPSTMFAANYNDPLSCYSTIVGSPIFSAYNCNFSKFIFSSELQGYRYFYSILGSDGQLLYHSYAKEITDEEQIELQKTWIEIPDTISSGFTFNLYVVNNGDLSLGCDTQLMFYNKDVFAGTTKVTVQLNPGNDDYITISPEKYYKDTSIFRTWDIATINLPAGVSKLEVDLCAANQVYSKTIGDTTITLDTDTETNWIPIRIIHFESVDTYFVDEVLGNEAVSAINVKYRYNRRKKVYNKLSSDFLTSSEEFISEGKELTWEDIATDLSTVHEFTNYAQPRAITLYINVYSSWSLSSFWFETKKTDIILIGYNSSGVPHSAVRYRIVAGGEMLALHDKDHNTVIDIWSGQ